LDPGGLGDILSTLQLSVVEIRRIRPEEAATAKRIRNGGKGQLIGVGVRQGYMITMEMAEDHVGGFCKFIDDPFPNRGADDHLERVGHKAMPDISQRHAGIDEHFAVIEGNQTTKPPDAKGFRAEYFDLHFLQLRIKRNSPFIPSLLQTA
jgi:hypothetical protein